MSSDFIFVYGTLKLGYWNNTLLEEATYVGEAQTWKSFMMADGGFPVVYDRRDPRFEEQANQYSGFIRGEVYEVSEEELERCDSLEGHPDWYCRERTLVFVDKGDDIVPLSPWIYIGTNVSRPVELLMTPTNGILEWKRST